MNALTHISLFTGIGGIDLAAEWAGFETVLMVENNTYCQKVLKKHWPDVPILEDIFNVKRETIEEAIADALGRGKQQSERDIAEGRGRSGDSGKAGIMADTESWGCGRAELQCDKEKTDRGWGYNALQSDKTRRGRETRQTTDSPVTLITGGFPCQPFSIAGKQRGKEDDRYLWPEMFRVIKEVRPRWVVAENVAGLITMGLDDCLSDLEGEGYITETFLIPACAVNAPHRRDRIFIVANTRSKRWRGRSNGNEEGYIRPLQTSGPSSEDKQQDVADTSRERLQRAIYAENSNCQAGSIKQGGEIARAISQANQWAVEPELGRVAHGIPSRVDRLRCLGNAVVPQQIYPILKAIADMEV